MKKDIPLKVLLYGCGALLLGVVLIAVVLAFMERGYNYHSCLLMVIAVVLGAIEITLIVVSHSTNEREDKSSKMPTPSLDDKIVELLKKILEK